MHDKPSFILYIDINKRKKKNKCDYVFSWPINICKSHDDVENEPIDCERSSEDNDGRLCKTINLKKKKKEFKILKILIIIYRSLPITRNDRVWS